MTAMFMDATEFYSDCSSWDVGEVVNSVNWATGSKIKPEEWPDFPDTRIGARAQERLRQAIEENEETDETDE